MAYKITEITMRFIDYIYKYAPTYRVTLPGYPIREAKIQIGMAHVATENMCMVSLFN